jgi:hypothetical protein
LPPLSAPLCAVFGTPTGAQYYLLNTINYTLDIYSSYCGRTRNASLTAHTRLKQLGHAFVLPSHTPFSTAEQPAQEDSNSILTSRMVTFVMPG